MTVKLTKLNESYGVIKCDRGIAQEISEYFSFFANGYKFVPSYRSRIWDGKLRLAKILPNGDIELPIGLLNHLKIFCTERKYSLELEDFTQFTVIEREYLQKFVDKLNIHSNGKKIEVRDYQFESVLDFLNSGRLVLLSPTSSGKSVILYIIVRFLLTHGLKKGLLLVPNISLCHQLTSDFVDYSSHNGWDAEANTLKIFGGTPKDTDQPLYISTWQSLDKVKVGKYFDKFQYVLCDECFSGESNVLTKNGYKKIKDIVVGDIVINYSESDGVFKEDCVVDVHNNLHLSSSEKMYKLEFDNGVVIECTGNHKFLTHTGWKRADELSGDDEIINTNNVI